MKLNRGYDHEAGTSDRRAIAHGGEMVRTRAVSRRCQDNGSAGVLQAAFCPYVYQRIMEIAHRLMKCSTEISMGLAAMWWILVILFW